MKTCLVFQVFSDIENYQDLVYPGNGQIVPSHKAVSTALVKL